MAKQKRQTHNPHPSYRNPTIAEALCEIHFSLPDGGPWKASLAGTFFKKVQNEFPEMEPATEIGLQFELGPQRIGHSLFPPRQRTRFKHKDRPLILQLGPNVFTVNILPKYAGWDNMRKDVSAAWRKAKNVLNPERITKIGLRYINRVNFSEDSETPGEWFKTCDFLPAAALRSRGSFLSRVESQIDAKNHIIVTLAEGQSDDNEQKRGIIFDIDRIIRKDIPSENKVLLAELDHLHEDIWEIFNAVQTERLKKHLEGGEK